jgi:hypothetical protein
VRWFCRGCGTAWRAICAGISANDRDQDGDHRTDSGENSKDCLEIHNFTFSKISFHDW